MKPQSAKAKGRTLQQWVCQKVSELTGFTYGKDCPIESRPMGQSGVDVRLEEAVLKVFPVSIECKNQEKWSLLAWIEQAKQNRKEGTYWLLVVKKNRIKPIIVMDAEEFFELLKRIREDNQNGTKQS